MIRFRGIEIDNEQRLIRHGDHVVRRFTSLQWRMTISLILGGGLTTSELFNFMYGHREDGGPLLGRDAAKVLVWQSILRGMFDALDLKLYKTHGSGYMRYELIPKNMESGTR